MKKRLTVPALFLALALLCGACGLDAPRPEPEASAPQHAGGPLEQLADAQLGLLSGHISAAERERVLSLLGALEPLRRERLEAGRWQKSGEETRLLRQLNRLYERYTVKYLGEGGTWGYGSPSERTLAEYRIVDGEALRPISVSDGAGYTEGDYLRLWDQMLAMLPEGAFGRFTRFTVFTDGVDETLAYVSAVDGAGSTWEIAVDPADAQDGAWFTETVLHEYCHSLTLNDTQAVYTTQQTVDTYNEPGMVARPGSYLDDFYQEFWADTLDDRLANPDTYNFFLRHEDDFVTDYASTDPSEDIAESFTYFVLYDPMEGDAVWERKLNFFYDYPELAEFRDRVRERLGLSAGAGEGGAS